MKRIGLIGGVSWAATATYYRTINTMVQAALGGNNSADMLIRSLNMQHAIDLMVDPAKVELLVQDAALDLVAAGAEVLGLASLTGHRYVGLLQEIKAPFISIEQCIARELEANAAKPVGIFATSVAVHDHTLMARLCGTCKHPLVIPSGAAQMKLDSVIFEELAHQRFPLAARAALLEVADELIARGARSILLGTTEFNVCAREINLPVPVIDSTDLHCRKLIEYACAPSDMLSSEVANV